MATTTGSYINSRGVTLSGSSPGATVHHNFWAANPGTVTNAIGGGHTLWADAFDDTFYIYTATDLVVVPAGNPHVDTIIDGAWNSTYTLADNVQNLTLAGDHQVVTGNAGDNLIIAQSGTATINGGGGDDVIVCGTGPDMIIDAAGSGSDVIYGFKHGVDHVRLDGSSLTSFAAVQTAMQQVGSDVLLTMGGGQTLTFRNTQVADFTANDFYLPVNTAGMALTFDDEFNSLSASGSGIGTVWRSTMGHGARSLPGNHEWEYYTDSSVGSSPFAVDNGVLAITAAPTDPASNSLGLPYTSGVITTEKSFAQLYGYFEMRAELPAGQGFWPAFWLLPADGSWPPEIDVMEQIGSKPTTDVVTVHSNVGGWNTSVASQVVVPDTSQGFHTYGVYWGPDVIRWYFDGQQIAQAATPADLNKPMYMLVNLAVGGPGSWPGTPASGATAQMLVDYVRAYAYNPSQVSTPSAPAATALISSTDLDFGIVHVGDSITRALTIANGATGSAADLLVGDFASVSGPFAATGSLGGGLAAGAAAEFDFVLTALNTGTVTGTAALALSSRDATAGDSAVSAPAITLHGTINNYATAGIAVTGGASMTQSGTTISIDLGTINGNASTTIGLAIANVASGPADWLSGSFRISGSYDFHNAGFDAFSGLGAGQADTALAITFSSPIAGVFSETITLTASGSNASGYSAGLPVETIVLTGTVAPQYTLGTGIDTINAGNGDDMIYATGGQLGAGDVLNANGGNDTLVLQGGGAFDLSSIRGFTGFEHILVQESADAARQVITLRNYVDLTVDVVGPADGSRGAGVTIYAGANNDVINLAAGNNAIYVNGAGQTVHGCGHDVVFIATDKLGAKLDGGGLGSQLVITSAGRATLGSNITGFGLVQLAQSNGNLILQAGGMQDLRILGRPGGGDTIILGDASQSVIGGGAGEHIQATADLASAAVWGLGANSVFEVTTGGTVTLNAITGGLSADTALTVKLDAASTLLLSPMSFLKAQGSAGADQIIAGASGQVLTGGGGADTLVGFAGGGDIFRDTSAGLNGDTIQGLAAGSTIDLTDLAFTKASYKFDAAQGVLSVSDGYHAASIHLTDAIGAGGFALASDGSNGTLISLHA